jgi:hypothetical protein
MSLRCCCKAARSNRQRVLPRQCGSPCTTIGSSGAQVRCPSGRVSASLRSSAIPKMSQAL